MTSEPTCDPATGRCAETAISRLFLERWSPRAFDGSAMSGEDLLTILDAGRWAPSSFNHQPWRFLYAHRGDEHWERFLGALLPFNQAWVRNASVLLFIVSERTMGAPDKPNHSHSFDAGAAWAFIALQAHLSGFHTHGMTGIDFAVAATVLGIPGEFRLEAAVAIGRIGDAALLPDKLRAREIPSGRKPLSDLAVHGPLHVGRTTEAQHSR